MTRAEFFSKRAQADYLKREAVTVCPPAAADGSAPPPPRTKYRVRMRNVWSGVAARITKHPSDESGAASPVRIRRKAI